MSSSLPNGQAKRIQPRTCFCGRYILPNFFKGRNVMPLTEHFNSFWTERDIQLSADHSYETAGIVKLRDDEMHSRLILHECKYEKSWEPRRTVTSSSRRPRAAETTKEAFCDAGTLCRLVKTANYVKKSSFMLSCTCKDDWFLLYHTKTAKSDDFKRIIRVLCFSNAYTCSWLACFSKVAQAVQQWMMNK